MLAVLALCPLAALLAPTDPTAPLARAAAIGRFEASLGLAFEPSATAWLAARPVLQDAAGFFYFWVHLPRRSACSCGCGSSDGRVSAGAPRLRAPQLATVAANVLLPTAPPWMSAADAADAASRSHVVYLVQSPFAAMPSGHLAFATFAAGTLIALVRSAWIRAVAVAYLVLVVAIVTATGNHFWLDAAAGAAVAAASLALSRGVMWPTRVPASYPVQ